MDCSLCVLAPASSQSSLKRLLRQARMILQLLEAPWSPAHLPAFAHPTAMVLDPEVRWQQDPPALLLAEPTGDAWGGAGQVTSACLSCGPCTRLLVLQPAAQSQKGACRSVTPKGPDTLGGERGRCGRTLQGPL